MRRREFLVRSATAAGAVWLSSKSILASLANATLPTKFAASDTVTLGSTGIKTSRLAMGTGTVGSEHHSHQTALGEDGTAPRRVRLGAPIGVAITIEIAADSAPAADAK